MSTSAIDSEFSEERIWCAISSFRISEKASKKIVVFALSWVLVITFEMFLDPGYLDPVRDDC